MKCLIIKNAANAFTALRVACTPIILFVTYKLLDGNTSMELYIYFIFLYLIICTSDFIDGKIARTYGIETRFGVIFDLIADFCFVTFMHTVMIIHHIIPGWFIFVILDRFFNFMITSKIENNSESQNFQPKSDKIGQYIAISMYITPFIVLVNYFFWSSQLFLTHLIVYCITGLSIVTSYSRIINIKSLIVKKVE
ncbi:hypothetical protein GC105_06555 [Alkalibaculum sp. M08DMB]|uniref:CDP-diacylglycerol--glycerol-3-phosphate 3-phosphatidyltransferase n=1 Tax=Alkalibaculum sporogenes TaxID=2655001 RepID=A0A6A7K7Q0_9FIRM|nr:CDP-alcohol phosphatidyltransferase family protein [Alkalibaculum sporogenes]MPW25444.1 hypothetical protein [Alkalibaculum sporogenes]